jgi:ATP:ADP antiporter, AAA family
VGEQAERSDRRAAFAALLAAAMMIAQQVGNKATRDALFLSSFDPEDLPRVVIASAGAAMLAVFAAIRVFARFGPARAVPFAFAISAAIFVLEWLLEASAPRAVAVILYLHTSIFGALVISGFWSVVNERFDPHTAKRVVSRINMGATFGGVAGGGLAYWMGAWSDATNMLWMLAGLNALAAIFVREIGGSTFKPTAAESTASAISILRGTPYLRGLAGIVVLTAVSAGLLDYAFKAEAAAHFEQGSDALLAFFAIFHTASAVLSLALQTGLAKTSLEKLGVAGTVATLPTVVLLSAAVAAAVPRLASVVVARGAELVLANSIFRSGYELLYTPVAPEKKRSTKALIDVAGNRLGDAMGSGITLLVLALTPAFPITVVLALAAAIAAASLYVARRLHRGYVRQLEQSLRSGTPGSEDALAIQAATLQTLSTLGLDRETLFEQLAAQQSWSERQTHPSVDGSDDGRSAKQPDEVDAAEGDPIHAEVRTLRSGDAPEVRALLKTETMDPRLVPYAIALLARRDVYHDAIAALRRTLGNDEHAANEARKRDAPAYVDTARPTSAVASLVKALLDPDQPFAIRRRLPRVLEVCESVEAAEGLAAGLDDERFEVRYRCALALARIAARKSDLRPSTDRVHDVVKKELEAGRKVWDSRRLLDDDVDEDTMLAPHGRAPVGARDESSPSAPPPSPLLLDKALRDRVHRSVEHVFTLLSLAYDPEPLRLSLVALASEDRTLRGTALEYLENVLPDEIRAGLFPMLDVRVEIRKKRTRQEIVEELVRSMQSVDARALQRAIDEKGRPS